MEIKLTKSDLATMPAGLRRQLLDHLEARKAKKSLRRTAADGLDRPQLIALMREVSFHRQGRLLRAILRRLARASSRPTTRTQLAAALPPDDRPRLARYIGILNRLASKASPNHRSPLCQIDRSTDAVVVQPATQRALRELLTELERSGEHEEPLWE